MLKLIGKSRSPAPLPFGAMTNLPPDYFSGGLGKVIRLFAIAAGLFSTLSAAQYDQRLANLSTRGQVGTGSGVMITGLIIQAGAPKQVLIRAVGPTLGAAPYSVPGTISNPILSLYNSSNALVATTNKWLATDAATMAAVGAFPLKTGSNDAAMVVTLSPGTYTAQVSGLNNGTGIALLEVYDVSGAARLMNLSTRALVGSDANMLISGLIVAPNGGIRKVLIRAVGPGLTSLGVGGALADPVFSVIDSSGRVIASNDNWGTADINGELQAAFAQSGAFPLPANSKDAALIVDLQPNANYTIQVSSIDGSTGLGLVEVYDLTPDTLATVSVAASVASTDTSGAAPAVFTLTRLGPTTSPVTVYYTVSGTAIAGVDYTTLPGSVTIPAGASSVNVPVVASTASRNSTNTSVTLTVAPGLSYGIGTGNATVTIFYNPGSLYVANLRAAAGATNSTAYGTATLQLSPDETYALVNVSFSNLSSPEVTAHLVINGVFVEGVPPGQVNGSVWVFQPTGAYSAADLIAAIKAGRVYVSIDTSAYPGGELTGSFLKSTGSGVFSVPSAPPPVDLTQVSQADAARFLTQATFGPSATDINAFVSQGYTTWLNTQIAMAPTLHRAATLADFAQYTQSATTTAPTGTDRQAAWWKIAVTAPDQLRQRVAFALSEIFVISDQNSTVSGAQEGAANYYDLLARDAFGNYRQLLEDVTLSPMMGIYLSSLRNAKGTFDSKGNVLTSADENYAREVMQLFSIGLNLLQPDGTLQLDSTGQPIPTYNQTTITETAKVFTGWAYYSTSANPNFRGGAADYIDPMMLYPAFHDDGQKTVVGGRIIPASQGGAKDLKDMLDTLFNHPNTGPFISRELIQRLVTSNPSPGYVYRVAQVFADNGAGVRGDLAAVVRAILTDYEARSPALVGTPGHGKLKEPLLRATAVLRAFGGASNSGRFNISNPETNLDQAALRSATVFNFFQPDFVQPGDLASAGLYAPEFQILTATTAITIPNFLYTYVYNTRSTTNATEQTIGLDLSSLLPLAATPQQLVDTLNLVLTGNTMAKATSDRIVAAIGGMPGGTSTTEKVRSAIYLITTSPDGSIQK